MPGDKDIVEAARRLDGWAILAMPPSFGMPETATFDGAQRVDALFRALADEVESLREHLADVNHDFESSSKFCDEHHVLGSEY